MPKLVTCIILNRKHNLIWWILNSYVVPKSEESWDLVLTLFLEQVNLSEPLFSILKPEIELHEYD